jgi:hypothetical protein
VPRRVSRPRRRPCARPSSTSLTRTCVRQSRGSRAARCAPRVVS